jgi:hypothetical protein
MSEREKPISIEWSENGIGRIMIDDKLWACVEWSEKHQRWCIEDAEGHCLTHREHIHGGDIDRDAAVALAEAMIRDGRRPDPETARRNLDAESESRKERNERRKQQPEQVAKREQKRLEDKQQYHLWDKAREAEEADEQEPPLYESIANAFDLSDTDLWKSNSFASLRPRLIISVKCAIAKCESAICDAADRAQKQPFRGIYSTNKEIRRRDRESRQAGCAKEIAALQGKLDRAREILRLLEPEVAP